MTTPKQSATSSGPDSLTVTLSSFSYKQGLPVSSDGHGGGFVFDCRCLPNPGREDRYRSKTGLDLEVAEYLRGEAGVSEFLENCLALIEQAITNYRARGFGSLAVSYGCTG